MKKLWLLAILIAASLLVAGISLAGDDGEKKYKVKVVLDDEADLVGVDFEEMEVGETKTFTTKSGKEVTITRTEEGHTLKVDGKEIHLSGHGDHMLVHKCCKGEECPEGGKECCKGVKKIMIEAGEEGEHDVYVMSASAAAHAGPHGAQVWAHKCEEGEEDCEEHHGAHVLIHKCEEGDEECLEKHKGHHGLVWIGKCEEGDEECEERQAHQMLVRKCKEGDEDCEKIFIRTMGIHADDAHVLHISGEEGEHPGLIEVMRPDPVKILEESGVLDEVDPEVREKIIKVLEKSMAKHKVIRTKVHVEVDEDDDKQP